MLRIFPNKFLSTKVMSRPLFFSILVPSLIIINACSLDNNGNVAAKPIAKNIDKEESITVEVAPVRRGVFDLESLSNG
jgi:hypothetical protein